MKLKYGTYTHGANECAIQISRETWRDERGNVRGYMETWTITGRLLATGADLVANLTTQIAALKVAYAEDGKNLTLYEDDATTETDHKLVTADAVGGVQVDGPSFPSGSGAEYATYRDYTIVAKAMIETGSIELMSFQESISVQGTGGRRFLLLQPLKGAPVKQDVAERTPVQVVQEGSAVGRTAYPSVPAPILAGWEHVDQRSITRRNPKRTGDGKYREYEISWHYVMEQITAPSAATPHTGA